MRDPTVHNVDSLCCRHFRRRKPMLSDVLAMAIQEMEEYQEEDDGYDGSRAQIEYVKAAMQRLVNYYSTPRNEDFCPTCGWCTWDCQCPEEVFWQGIDASIGRQVFHDLQERTVAGELER